MSVSHRIAAVAIIVSCMAFPLASNAKSSPQPLAPRAAPLPSWPPRPELIVNVDSTTLSNPSGGVLVLPGVVEIYTVPNNKCLVLTDLELSDVGQLTISLCQELGGTITFKRGSGFNRTVFQTGLQPYHSSVGLKFAPGSKVVLNNTGPSNGTDVAYTMTGYLAAP